MEKGLPRPEQGRGRGHGRDAGGAPGVPSARPSEVHTAMEGHRENDAVRRRGMDQRKKGPPQHEQRRGRGEPGRGRVTSSGRAPEISIPGSPEVHAATEGLDEDDGMRRRGMDTRNEGPPRTGQGSGGGSDTNAGDKTEISTRRPGMLELEKGNDDIADGGSRQSQEVRKEGPLRPELGGGSSRGKGRKEAVAASEGRPLRQQRTGNAAEFKAWVDRQIAWGRKFSLPRDRRIEEYGFALAAAAAAAGDARSSSTMAALDVSKPATASSSAPAAAPRDGSTASSLAQAPAAASTASVAEVGAPEKKKPPCHSRRSAVLERIHPRHPQGPLLVSDESICRQGIQAVRGTSVDIENLSGEESLRRVLPHGTKLGRGVLGPGPLYNAADEFFKNS